MHMEKSYKKEYESPALMVVEVKTEGVICESIPGQGGLDDYNVKSAQDW